MPSPSSLFLAAAAPFLLSLLLTAQVGISNATPIFPLAASASSSTIVTKNQIIQTPAQARAQEPPSFDVCTTYPAWTVQKFTSYSTDSVGGGTAGTVSFYLTNSLTGARDEVSCKLQVNYRCIVQGLGSDRNTTVHVAIRAGFVTLIVDEEVGGCPGRDTPLHIIGTEDLEIKCSEDNPDEVGIGGPVACTQALGEEIVQGEAVELAPG